MSGLFLTELTLSHFRSHKAARIACDGRPVAIYGPNGAGKTNILEAVSLFSPGRGLRRSSADDMTRRPEALGWKLTGILRSLHQMHEIEIWSENRTARQVRIDEKQAAQVALGRIARVLWLVPSMDRLWIEGAEGRRRAAGISHPGPNSMTRAIEVPPACAQLEHKVGLKKWLSIESRSSDLIAHLNST